MQALRLAFNPYLAAIAQGKDLRSLQVRDTPRGNTIEPCAPSALGIVLADTAVPMSTDLPPEDGSEFSQDFDAPTGAALGPAPRRPVYVTRIIRSSAVAVRVKEIHGYACQICGIVLTGSDGLYAEAAHIHPLGEGGPDVESNILCLCPNHHVLFDRSAIAITTDFEVLDYQGHSLGRLRLLATDRIGAQYLAHRTKHRGVGSASS
jgi:HNH endonuclease